ncbi:MAG: hypothetical protein KDE50_23290, partial [Caldilineaceae bacterium]|nr:hypothetical protein [Caldilineaceae bacterium]
MGLDFDWTTNDDEQREAVLLSTGSRHKHSWRPWLIGITTVVILALGAWIGYRIVEQRNQAALEQAAQA